MQKTYLTTSYLERMEAKDLGARWEGSLRFSRIKALMEWTPVRHQPWRQEVGWMIFRAHKNHKFPFSDPVLEPQTSIIGIGRIPSAAQTPRENGSTLLRLTVSV